ncbi:glycophorin-A [Suricata suricatta]|uniref:glycophorin-A n=1 Tax=Suricata suricatta TaxID=37032 RepID=UPI001155B612|nr:glycophorin-A [Suricata suricatta]
MYKKIILLTVLLFSGYSSSQETTESHPVGSPTHESPSLDTTASQRFSTPGRVGQRFNIPGAVYNPRIFSTGEIVGIVYAVMAGVVGTILLTAFCIKKLIKKSSSPVKHVHSEDADPESSVEPRNPEQ